MRTPTAFRLARLLALVLAVASAATAHLAGAAQRETRERTAYVSAVDDKGEPVEGLGPDAFIIREDGARREVLRVTRATDPMDLGILVDNSQASAEGISHLRTALEKFMARVGPNNQVALITLADRPTISVDYTNDPKKLSDAVKRLFPMPGSGMTLLDALYETSRGFTKREAARPVLVAVFTEGQEFTNYDSKTVVKAMTDAGAQLHLVSIGVFPHSEAHDLRERSFLLDEGPRATGGQRISLLSPNALDQALERLGRQLTMEYKVVYGRPESLIPPEKIEITSARADVTMHGTPAREAGARR
jgi:VWFA-related protein